MQTEWRNAPLYIVMCFHWLSQLPKMWIIGERGSKADNRERERERCNSANVVFGCDEQESWYLLCDSCYFSMFWSFFVVVNFLAFIHSIHIAMDLHSQYIWLRRACNLLWFYTDLTTLTNQIHLATNLENQYWKTTTTKVAAAVPAEALVAVTIRTKTYPHTHTYTEDEKRKPKNEKEADKTNFI